MGTYPYGASSAGGNVWCGHEDGTYSAPEIDGLLAGAGYRVRSSDLRHVAQSLQRLDSAMAVDPPDSTAEAVLHHNPTDLAAWVDSMLSEHAPPDPTGPVAPRHTLEPAPAPAPPPEALAGPLYSYLPAPTWRVEDEEDSGIRLVHSLIRCADSVQRGDHGLAAALVDEMRALLARLTAGFGIAKVAVHFVDALSRRIYGCGGGGGAISAAEDEILYHHFYEASPCLKFAHFTANQAILEAIDGCDRVHVIDLGLMRGLQWPALIQALALRPGGPPALRLTGIGPPSADGRDALREVGLRLAELARSVGLPFAFRGVAAARIDDVQPWMLHVAPGETLAVNSVLQLHRLLSDSGRVDSLLDWVANLKPRIITVVEQEADHNQPGFLDRFTEALFYYSTVFDSLAAGRTRSTTHVAAAEAYLQGEINDIVCGDGAARVERHEPLSRWRARMGRAGLSPVRLGSNAFRQASMLLTIFAREEGYCVEEVDGCLTLGWYNRPLIAASAWRADDDVARSPAPDEILLFNGINNGNIGYRDSSNSSTHNMVSALEKSTHRL